MTKNTSTQKVAVFILLIIFVSSFSSVLSSERSLKGTVHVVLPNLRVRYAPRSIVVVLVAARSNLLPKQEVEIQWSDCECTDPSATTKWKKCAYEFNFDAPGIQSYSIGVRLGDKLGNDYKGAFSSEKIVIPRHEYVEQNIKYDISKPEVTLD